MTETLNLTEYLADYPHGVPTEIEVPDLSVSSLVDEAVRDFPNRTAVEFMGRATSFRSLADQIDRAAGLFLSLGVKPGDRIALALPNCPQHVVSFYAALRIGAIAVEHNPLAPTPDIARQLASNGAKIVIAWQKTISTIEQARTINVAAGKDVVEHVFVVNMAKELPALLRFAIRLPVKLAREKRADLCAKVDSTIPRFEKAVAAASPVSPDHPQAASSDVAVMLYTGGTTGTPKAAKLTHRNLMANVTQGEAWVPSLVRGEEIFYGVLPFFHAFGLTLCLTFGMRLAATQVIFPRPDVSLILAEQRKRPCTFVAAVPTLFKRLAAAAKEHRVDFTSVRVAISGAMALPPEVAVAWEEVTGGYLIEGYGMTETSPCIVGNPVSEGRRAGFLGLPFPSTEFRIVDPEDPSRDLGPDGHGELLVRGPQIFEGYWNNPEETANIFIGDGWLRTGDQVTLENGLIRMTDRLKEVIITGGFNVYPSVVEAELRQIDGVEDVAVVGLPTDDSGETVVAAFVMKEGATIDLAQVRKFCTERLARYAIPREIVILDELPRSQIGKVMRRTVRDDAMAMIAAPVPAPAAPPPSAASLAAAAAAATVASAAASATEAANAAAEAAKAMRNRPETGRS